MATNSNDIILISEADIAGLDALGGVDTLVGKTAIKTLSMAAAHAEIFRGSAIVLADNDDIVTAVGSTVAVKLYGDLGNDIFTGSSLADVLDGGVGNDFLDGGDGNDTLTGGAGSDTLLGGAGNDLIYFDADDILSGGVNAGAGTGDRGVLQGTAAVSIADLSALGIEILTLSSGGDTVGVSAGVLTPLSISGLAGSDTLSGGDGNDTLDGGADDDNLSGGIGNDRLLGGTGTGADTLDGGSGSDWLDGAAGNDDLAGGDGNDTLTGGAGFDTLRGGAGNDTIYFDADDIAGGIVDAGDGTADKGFLQGTAAVSIADIATLGFESLTLGAGADLVGAQAGSSVALTLSGLGGNDTLSGGGGRDTIDGGADDDNLSGGNGDDRLVGGTGLDVLSGGEGADQLLGGAGGDVLDGGNGNDLLDGGTENDSLSGGAGSDRLTGGAGADTLSGGSENDTLYIDAADLTSGLVDGGSGIDTAYLDATSGGVTIADLAALSIEALNLAAGNDSVTTASTIGTSVSVSGMAGDDTLVGGAGNEFLDGGAGSDSLVGGDGADVLRDVAGTIDTLIGGAGDDIIYIDQLDVDFGVIDGGTGSDRALAVTAVTGFMLAAHNIEHFSGSAGADSADATGVATAVSMAGGAGNDTLVGGSGADGVDAGAGDDSVAGGFGNDTLYGGDGADTLSGGDGNDWLQGGSAFASSDTLIGGAGNDTLSGGGGSDYAQFSGNLADYDFVKVTTGNPNTSGYRVTHARNNAVTDDGIDLVTLDTEFISFGDVTIDTTVNHATVAADDTATVAEGGVLNGNVLTNDVDYDVTIGKQLASALTVSLVSGPANGALTLNTDGTYTYTPAGDFVGTDSFTYKVNDGFADSNTATVLITVTEVNDAPVASDDTLSSIAEDSGVRIISIASLLANDSTGPANESGQTLTLTAISNVVGGTAVINGANIEFTPAADFNGTASFDYTVQDDGTTNGVADAKTDTGSVSFSVTAVNDPPVGVADSIYINGPNGATFVLQNAWLVKNDTDADGDTLNVDSATSGTSITAGTVTTTTTTITSALGGGATGNTAGTVTTTTTTITSALGGGATGNFTYVATDGSALSASTTVTVVRSASNSSITGSSGNDILVETRNNSTTMNGGAGSDFITGGTAADTIIADQADYLIDGRGGSDILSVGTAFTSTGDAQIVNVENVTLSAAVALDLSSQTEGFTITGSTGADTITSGSGADSITGGNGADSIVAGLGNDTITADASDTLIDGAGGTDRLAVGASFTSASDAQLVNIENVVLSAALTLNLANQTEAFSITGSTGADTITGGGGADTISAGTGADIITGGAGGDSMAGGTGADTFVIGSAAHLGSDTIDGSSEATTLDVLQLSAAGTYNLGSDISNIDDVVLNSNAAGFVVTLTEAMISTGDHNADGTAGDIQVRSAVAMTNGVSIDGSAVTVSSFEVDGANLGGADTVLGGTGADSITGGAGADTISGGGGSDTINGGTGNDTINGGAGGDSITGGTGADVIDTGAANDDITDRIVFTATGDYGDTVSNFDATGTSDIILFSGALNTSFDDGNSNDNILFVSGNGAAGTVSVTVGQNNGDAEGLLLTGANSEGVANANLSSAASVAAAFNAEFAITAANGEDCILVINDTDANSFAVWQWIQASGGGAEVDAGELTLIGLFSANGTVSAAHFDFI